jgi:hypothetical protein
VDDAEFARRFERGEIGEDAFHHREHLRLAWVCLREVGSVAVACERVGAAIRAFARRAGKEARYHETLTRFWVLLLAAVQRSTPGEPALDAVLAAQPWLLDKDTPLAYYSRALLSGDAARAAWQPPDLQPLPHDAPAIDPRRPPRHS